MASLLFAAGILSYDQIKKQKQKHAAKKAHNNARFSELERDNAARISALQEGTCFCQQSDWRGGGCERHGYVPAAGTPGGPPAYMRREGVEEVDSAGGVGLEGRARRAEPPEYRDHTLVGIDSTTASNSGYQYHRGEEDGFLASQPLTEQRSVSRAPAPMPEDEVRRINEERRRKMKGGGFSNWRLKRKGNKQEVIVR